MHTGFKNRTCISHSANSVITKAQKGGKMWVLKSVPQDADNPLLREELLKKEYNILCLLNHPSIVQVVDLICDEELGTAIVMEYVEGNRLSSLTQLSNEDKRHIISTLLDAVDYIHSKQIVHRDLKPDNIMITHNGHNLKIMDFGFADTDSHTVLKQPAGTLDYISPEQMVQSQADVRNDIYSLGIILSKMNLGWKYRHIIRRMTTSIDKRYTKISEIKAAFARASLIPQIITISTFSFVLLIVIGMGLYNIHSQQQRINEQEQKIQIQSKTIDTQAKNIKTQTNKIIQQSATIDKLSQAKAEQDHFESLFVQGKKTIDNYLLSTNFKQHKKNADNIKELEKTLKISEETNTIIQSYVKKQQLSSQKTSELNTLLVDYFMREYWQ